MSRRRGEEIFIKSSGDVFEDLGVELDAKDRLKIAIALQITNLVQAQNLTQNEVAERLGTDQAKISSIARGRLTGFSVERLINYLITLGVDIDIHFSKSDQHSGHVTVHPERIAM